MRFKFLLLFAAIALISCRTQLPPGDDGILDLTLIQVNDVYEIAPLEAGNSGGLARIAALKKREQAQNPNTLLLMAGDFLSPSVYGSLRYEGKRIRGRQMVDAMNTARFDLACFGNHEFDITETELQERIDESGFTWISANAFHKTGDTIRAFRNNRTQSGFPRYVLKTLTDADGTKATIGFISVVLPSNPASYVHYTDPVQSAVETYRLIEDSCDAIVALTHLAITDDKRLADALPGLAAILGGHEHDMKFEKQNGIYITKAHANAKSAFVVKIKVDTRKNKAVTKPALVYLNREIPLDSTTDVTVRKWVQIANDSYAGSGFNASAPLPYTGRALDGRDEATRSGTTNLTQLIAASMLFASPGADAAVFNTGSIRVDDILYPPITQYDILRTLPFGGGLREIELKGALLQQVLDSGYANRGSGGWLQYGNISRNATGQWLLKGQVINPTGVYLVVVPEFLVSGKETRLSFFHENNPGIVKAWPLRAGNPLQADIRLAVIRYLEERKP